MKYQIDSNVPLWASKRELSEPTKLGITLKPGQSIGGLSIREAGRIFSALKHRGQKATTRKEDSGTIRVWRIS